MAGSTHQTAIRIPKELHKAARMKAIELDVTLSEAIRELLRMWVAGKVELPTETQEELTENT
jgi:antitoxin component of RelBE/YafQ-DinJ toxin-antitoxin module